MYYYGMDRSKGRALQKWRHERGWTTIRLAEELCREGAALSWRSIEEWEQGRRAPGPVAAAALERLGYREPVAGEAAG